MVCPELKDLPEPPSGKQGWPWTQEITPLSASQPKELDWPRVTIVTPSFNQVRFLESTIRSVLLQGYPNLEYLVLDGGSTDGSVDIIKKYSRWIDYWTSEPDGGQSAAINRGLQMGTGVYANWINSDDQLCKGALVGQISQIQHGTYVSPRLHTVHLGICHYMDANGHVTSSHRGRVHSLEDLVRISTVWRSGGHIVQPEVIFPRELALAVGGLDTENHYTMDYELWGKFFLAGAHFHYTAINVGMFRKHSNQKTHEGLRQTRSLINTAGKLVLQSQSFSEQTKKEILAGLHVYIDEYEKDEWRASGRLATLGLPTKTVMRLRGLKEFILKRVPFAKESV